ncbi:hypothetical protein ANRL3_02443 [Anaerolineae bacterium]|nr:hypothetical protein ANRL3_02443 [Anaerolineae bacterium]
MYVNMFVIIGSAIIAAIWIALQLTDANDAINRAINQGCNDESPRTKRYQCDQHFCHCSRLPADQRDLADACQATGKRLIQG